MDGSSLFVSTCTRRQLARRRSASRSWLGRYLRWRDSGGRWPIAGLLLTGGVDLLIVAAVIGGVTVFLVGHGTF